MAETYFWKKKIGYHVNQLCKKLSKKHHALTRIAKDIGINKQRMVHKAIVSSRISHWLKANQLVFTKKTFSC